MCKSAAVTTSEESARAARRAGSAMPERAWQPSLPAHRGSGGANGAQTRGAVWGCVKTVMVGCQQAGGEGARRLQREGGGGGGTR